jgi:hypothetical protein
MARVIGVHALIYTKNARALRAFFRDTLKFASVDAGEGWLIFSLPPAELGIHPTDKRDYHELYLMCDDITATVKSLSRKGVKFARQVRDEGWGLVTSIKIPGGGELGLYQPRHRLALSRKRRSAARTRA